MLSLQVTDIKNFMAQLLKGEVFDNFYFVEASVRMGISYHLDGHLNREFYDSDIKDNLNREFCLWKEVRSSIFHIIKGRRLPLSCRIILALPQSLTALLIEESRCSFCPEDIEGIYINILFEPGSLLVTTGISYRSFSLDKSLEYCSDDHIKTFFREKGIC